MAQKLQKVERNLYLDADTGIYHVRAMVNGKAYGPLSTFQTTLKMALRKRDAIMTGLQERSEAAKEIPTLGEHWASYRKRKTKAELTWRHQDQLMEQHVLPHYGSMRLNDLSKARMEWFIQRRRKDGAAESTIGLELKVVMAVLNDACDNGILDRNPLRKMKVPEIKIRTRVLSREDQAKLEAVATPEARRYILFLLSTGIRLDESVGLKSSDFAWDRHEFRVVGKGRKTRWVPILAPEALRRIVDDQLALTGSESLWTRGANALREMVYYTCDKAKLPQLGPHVLRHTFATRYLEGRGNIYVLSQILGHSSVKVTEKVYAHVKPRTLAELSAGIELGAAYEG